MKISVVVSKTVSEVPIRILHFRFDSLGPESKVVLELETVRDQKRPVIDELGRIPLKELRHIAKAIEALKH